MKVDEALVFLDTLLPPGSVNGIKAQIFKGAWEQQGYSQIAEEAGYTTEYVKESGAQLWKALSEALGQRVSKSNFRSLLRQHWQGLPPTVKQHDVKRHDVASNLAGEFLHQQEPVCNTRLDWGEAPDTSLFYGREQELVRLKECVLGEHARTVAILGMGGNGKTTLSVKFAEQVQHQFDCIIWRSLRLSTPLESLLGQLVPWLSNQTQTEGTLTNFVQCLRQSRCLVVLDNFETVLEPGVTGHYRAGFDDYGELLRVVGEAAHQSCVVLTSREKPPEIAVMEGESLAVKQLLLGGSHNVAVSIAQAKGVESSDVNIDSLCTFCGNNPLAVKIAATSVRDIFDGDVAAFLAEETLAFNGIRRLLDRQYSRLSPLEASIMTWLAIAQDWTSISDLSQNLVPAVSRYQLLEALESLNWRSLVERNGSRYTQQPVVMEYVTDNLVETVHQELSFAPFDTFCRFALQPTSAKDYIRESQRERLIEPIINLLRSAYPSPITLRQHLVNTLERLRELHQQPTHDGQNIAYGAGNLVNICRYIGIDLSGFDFSGLPIWHASLQDLKLPKARFTNAQFRHTTFAKPLAGVRAIAYSPDGNCLATGDSQGRVQLWSADDGSLLASLHRMTSWVWAIAFSPDGTMLACGGEDRSVKVFDLGSGQCISERAVESNVIWSLAFDPDSRCLAIGSSRAEVLLWDVLSDRTRILEGHTYDVHSILFSPDRKTIVSGSHDLTVRVWDVDSGDCLRTIIGPQTFICDVALNPVNGTLVCSCIDGSIWNCPPDIDRFQKLESVHQDAVLSVAFSPAGDQLVSCSYDGIVCFWEVSDYQPRSHVRAHRDNVNSLAFHPDGHTLASASSDCSFKLWDVSKATCLNTVQGYTNYVSCLCWHPDSNHNSFVTGGSNGRLRLWDAESGSRLQTLTGHSNWVWEVDWSPNGKMIASSSQDRSIKIWHAVTGRCLSELTGHKGWVISVAFSPCGTKLASCSIDFTVKVWNACTGSCLHTVTNLSGWNLTLAWSPDGEFIAVGDSAGKIQLWKAETGEPALSWQGHSGWLMCLCWRGDGTLFSAGYDHVVCMWDAATGDCLHTFAGHTAPPFALSLSPDGKTVASGGYDRTIRLWNADSGTCLNVLRDHEDVVGALAFSPDGQTLASGSEDNTIRLWDVASHECRQILRIDRPYEGTDITNAIGLSEAQQDALKALGAIENR